MVLCDGIRQLGVGQQRSACSDAMPISDYRPCRLVTWPTRRLTHAQWAVCRRLSSNVALSRMITITSLVCCSASTLLTATCGCWLLETSTSTTVSQSSHTHTHTQTDSTVVVVRHSLTHSLISDDD